MISESHDTILLRYEINDTIFLAMFKMKKKTNEFSILYIFKVTLFNLMHLESSKLRAPIHVS